MGAWRDDLLRAWASGRLADRCARAAFVALPAAAALALPLKAHVEPLAAAGVDRGAFLSEYKFVATRIGGWAALGLLAFLLVAKPRATTSAPPSLAAPRDPVARLGMFGLGALLAASLLSAFLSIAPLFSFWRGQILFLPAGLALVAVAARLRLRAGVFVASALATGAVVAAVLVAQHFGSNPLSAFYDLAMRNEDERAALISTIGNPERLGGYLAAMAAAAFALAAAPSGSKRRPLAISGWSALFAFLLFAAMLTGTRSSLVAAVAGGLFALATSTLAAGNKRALAIGAGALAAAALLGVAILSTPNPLNRRLANLAERFARGFDTRSASVSERALANVAGAEMIAEAPLLGCGPGLYDARFHDALANLAEREAAKSRGEERAELIASAVERLEEKAAGDAHNDYLQTWAESGALGLAGFLLFAVAALWPLPAGAGGRDRRAAIACQAALAATLALALLSFPLRTPERAWLFWACAAHALAARSIRPTSSDSEERGDVGNEEAEEPA